MHGPNRDFGGEGPLRKGKVNGEGQRNSGPPLSLLIARVVGSSVACIITLFILAFVWGFGLAMVQDAYEWSRDLWEGI
jgi:hypothetical protein